MYRREIDVLLLGIAAIGTTAGVFGWQEHALGGLLAALAAWLLVGVVSAWIVLRNTASMAAARESGWQILVPMRASALTRWLTVRNSRGPATEYHLLPSRSNGSAVVRRVMRDLGRVRREAPCPSVHLFAWRGISLAQVERLLSLCVAAGDEVTLWHHWGATYGVVRRKEMTEQ